MSLTNCEINLIFTSYEKCNKKKATTFAITDTNLYVPVVTLSTQDNEKLFKQLKSGFKSTINWKKYLSKVTIQGPNPYIDFLIDSSFKGLYRLFVLSPENTTYRRVHRKYSNCRNKGL